MADGSLAFFLNSLENWKRELILVFFENVRKNIDKNRINYEICETCYEVFLECGIEAIQIFLPNSKINIRNIENSGENYEKFILSVDWSFSCVDRRLR